MNTTILNYAPLFFKGLMVTLALWLSAATISFILGTVLGISQARFLKLGFITKALRIITYILRAIPVYVQVLIIYFVLPDLLGINLSPFTASVIALGCCSAAYVSEFMRGGINAIAQNQWEAAQTLGFSRSTTLRYIILPQVLAIVFPSFSNELESLLKSTSIFSTIGVLEITKVANTIIAREMNPLPVFCIVSLLYLALSSSLMLFMYTLRRKFKILGHH